MRAFFLAFGALAYTFACFVFLGPVGESTKIRGGLQHKIFRINGDFRSP